MGIEREGLSTIVVSRATALAILEEYNNIMIFSPELQNLPIYCTS